MIVRDTSDDEFIRCVSSKRQELKFIEKKQKKRSGEGGRCRTIYTGIACRYFWM